MPSLFVWLTWTCGLFVRLGQCVFDRLESLLNAAQLYFDSDESTAVKEDGQNRKNCPWTNWMPGSFFKGHLAMEKFGFLVFFWSSDWRSFQLNVQASNESLGCCVQLLWHDSYSVWIAVLCFMLFLYVYPSVSGSGPSHRKSQLSLKSNGAYVVWPEGTPLVVHIFLFVCLFVFLFVNEETNFELVILGVCIRTFQCQIHAIFLDLKGQLKLKPISNKR